MTDIENHMVCPHAEPEEPTPGIDDLDHDWLAKEKALDDEYDADQRLVRRLNHAIDRIGSSDQIDQNDLVGLLRTARDRIDPDPPLARRQAG